MPRKSDREYIFAHSFTCDRARYKNKRAPTTAVMMLKGSSCGASNKRAKISAINSKIAPPTAA
jgi:hypothetical protein